MASVSSMIARSETTDDHARLPIAGDIADIHKVDGTKKPEVVAKEIRKLL